MSMALLPISQKGLTPAAAGVLLTVDVAMAPTGTKAAAAKATKR